ncbi:CIC11C00000001774 [Sungouiella intermedia]|uniref:CIC11C00000001774 n=1 Tax=Sungouiella intermedia TaxID=45354 RepID=A0A1L0B8G7_9ASCO|nr:CIC11C00000001774 [[Candida] intermedia]
MQNQQLVEILEHEKSTSAKLEAELANLCFTLQHYQTVFADCEKLVGKRSGVDYLGELFRLLFEMLSTLSNTNQELERELTELEKPQLSFRVKEPTLCKVEIEEVWKLYDVVNTKLGEIDTLKSKIRDSKKHKLSNTYPTSGDEAFIKDDSRATIDVSAPPPTPMPLSTSMEIDITSPFLQRKPLEEVSNSFWNISTEQKFFHGEKVKRKRRRKRRPRNKITQVFAPTDTENIEPESEV